MPTSEAVDTVQRWFTNFAHRHEDFDTFVHADMVNHAAPPALQHGAASFRRSIESVIAAAGPDGGYQIDHIVAYTGPHELALTHVA